MQFSEILASSRRQLLVNLIGVDPAVGADQMRKYCRVVATTRSNLHHGLRLLDVAGCQPISVGTGLADIDPALAIQREEQILIEECGIIVGCLHVSVPTEVQPPGAWSGERLALHRAKRLLNERIVELGCGANQFGKEQAIFFRSVHHRASQTCTENQISWS
jgi:hypothetical protein